LLEIGQATDESPTAAQLAESGHQFVAALLQWQVGRVVFVTDDAEECRSRK
jgi:hypothetical protein